MITLKSVFTRASIVAFVALAGSLVERSTTIARAEEPATSPTKAPAAIPTKAETISDCTKLAYEALDKEVASLRALHAGDAAAFTRAYALRKKQLVGAEALAAKGCAPSRIEP